MKFGRAPTTCRKSVPLRLRPVFSLYSAGMIIQFRHSAALPAGLQDNRCAACDSIADCKAGFGDFYEFVKPDWGCGAVPHSCNGQLQLTTVALIPLRF